MFLCSRSGGTVTSKNQVVLKRSFKKVNGEGPVAQFMLEKHVCFALPLPHAEIEAPRRRRGKYQCYLLGHVELGISVQEWPQWRAEAGGCVLPPPQIGHLPQLGEVAAPAEGPTPARRESRGSSIATPRNEVPAPSWGRSSWLQPHRSSQPSPEGKTGSDYWPPGALPGNYPGVLTPPLGHPELGSICLSHEEVTRTIHSAGQSTAMCLKEGNLTKTCKMAECS